MKDVLYEGAFSRFVRDGRWEYVERRNVSGIVVIVALTDEGRVLLLEQYRAPVGKAVIELPAGLAGDLPGASDEPLIEAAKRELEEETGYRARSMERLTEGPPSAGITSEVLTLFFARGLKKVGPGGGDEEEDITVHEVPLEEVERWLDDKHRAGYPIDMKIFAGLYFLATRK